MNVPTELDKLITRYFTKTFSDHKFHYEDSFQDFAEWLSDDLSSKEVDVVAEDDWDDHKPQSVAVEFASQPDKLDGLMEDFVNMIIDHDSSTPDNDQDFQDKAESHKQAIIAHFLKIIEVSKPEIAIANGAFSDGYNFASKVYHTNLIKQVTKGNV